VKKIFLVLLVVGPFAKASDPYPKNPAIDVLQYVFQLEVNDSTDVISGNASITIQFKKPITRFDLDLVGKDASGTGMNVTEVTSKEKQLAYTHQNNRLTINLPYPVKAGESHTFQITYRGIPRDGLFIGKNKYGDRGFFGDNWPDRGHHWLPAVDHSSDKSAVDFIVIAPLHYEVVANGIKIEESPIDAKRKLTHWHEEVPIPVKVMVVGIARFAIQYLGTVNEVSVESWVFPQNRLEGFHDFAVAGNVLSYFNQNIGPYPYKKLANVQSKTRWGGLENANTIFYFENSVTGKGEREPLIAHEVAHQWFGNSATEKDWHHVWLSEGFATYFANLYLENKYGPDRLVEEQTKDRIEIINYYLKNPAPIVDTTILDINKVLNTNTYQKAGWVLHMLRHELGDQIFWKGIRQYYSSFRNSNALTGDFKKIINEASGKNLDSFFRQWLYQPGHPKLSGNWHYDAKTGLVEIELRQTQNGVHFQFPLNIGLRNEDGALDIRTLQVNTKSQKFTIPANTKPNDLVLDPGTWLLFEGAISQK
jgi:aminopeptidase N